MGKYGKLEGQTSKTSCVSCEIGTYNDDTGLNECKMCKIGTYVEHRGKTMCNECPKNTYNDQTGGTNKIDCKPCPKGKHQDAEGQGLCNKDTASLTFWVASIGAGIVVVVVVIVFYKLQWFNYCNKCKNKHATGATTGILQPLIDEDKSSSSRINNNTVRKYSIVEMSAPRESVCEVLEAAGLTQYKKNFSKIGLQTTNDLANAEDEDLVEAGLSNYELKKIKRAVKKTKKNEQGKSIAEEAKRKKELPSSEDTAAIQDDLKKIKRAAKKTKKNEQGKNIAEEAKRKKELPSSEDTAAIQDDLKNILIALKFEEYENNFLRADCSNAAQAKYLDEEELINDVGMKKFHAKRFVNFVKEDDTEV
jgi:hypothetical protein